ncbi:type VII secretion-associated serine protease mycosin, partial [Streptomyces murinus]
VKSAHPGLGPAQIRTLLEDTADAPPAGGRDDSRGYGTIDPVAALAAAGRLEPEKLSPVSYPHEYFGPGPDAPRATGSAADWAAPLAGSVGGVLLVVGVILWRGRRQPF